MAALITNLVFLLFLASSTSSHVHVSASSHLTFSLTHRDADTSPLRSPEADLAHLPADMPMRAFVAAGRALRARLRIMKTALSYEGQNRGDFYLTAALGTPPQDVIFLVDTCKEFCWTECSPCLNCTELTSPVPRFAYEKSTSFRAIHSESPLCLSSLGVMALSSLPCDISSTIGGPPDACTFRIKYGDGSAEAGFYSVDYFHLASGQFAKALVIGCAIIVRETVPAPNTGFLGFNAGPFSFPSQLFSASPGMPRKFAHCLPDRMSGVSAVGSLEFGYYNPPTGMKYTPFAPPYGPLGGAHYYVKLQAITVGRSLIEEKDIEVAEGMEVGEGGTVFDSGATITSLVKPLYDKLVGELRRQTLHLRPFNATYNSDLQSDLCYKVNGKATEPPNVPGITLHFAGGVDLELGPGSTLYAADYHASIVFCLAFDRSDDNLNSIGNYQQQNYWVEYNLDKLSLGLAKANCAQVK